MIFLAYISCLAIIYQDFKERTVNVFALIALFVANISIGFDSLRFSVFKLMGYNSAVILLLLLSLVMYYSVKRKKIHKVVDQEFGMGDILMLITLIPVFLTTNLLIFLILSILLSIITALFIKMKTIPFAGILAFTYLLFTLFSQLNWANGYKPIFY